jgi:hypothetical protein
MKATIILKLSALPLMLATFLQPAYPQQPLTVYMTLYGLLG